MKEKVMNANPNDVRLYRAKDSMASMGLGFLRYGMVLMLFLLLLPALSFAAPQLLFSDLQSGPKTGWEGSTTKGAAVTVWGAGFGSTRGSSYITVNGAQLSADTDYAEWDAVGPARGFERITFWINNTAMDGAGSITVTVNGVTSNSLPFTVRAGNIFFISKNDGSNTYNGAKSAFQGGSNGPWKDVYMWLPHYNGSVTKAGDVVYVRNSTTPYTQLEPGGSAVLFEIRAASGDYGTAGNPIALVGHPGDIAAGNWPQFGDNNGAKTISSCYRTALEQGYSQYLEMHKILWRPTAVAGEFVGSYFRKVGNRAEDAQASAWAGVFGALNGQHIKYTGNYFYNNGYDKYKHDIYTMADQSRNISPRDADDIEIAWNEFSHYRGDIGVDKGGDSITCSSQGSGNHLYMVKNYVAHDNYFHDGTGEMWRANDKVENPTFYNNISINMGGSGYEGITSAIRDFGQAPLISGNITIYNNTFYKGTGFSYGFLVTVNSGKTNFISKNNIYYGLSGTYVSLMQSGDNLNSDHDLFFGLGAPPSGNAMTVTGALNADPQFVNGAAGDFHLKSTSPAIDAGTSLVNSIVVKDYDNNPRPMDGNKDGTAQYDIGASEYTGTYVGDTTPPVISNVLVTNITASSATVTWTTNEASTSQVEYGTSTSYGSLTALDSSMAYSHTVNVTGLSSRTAYNFRVRSKDASSNEGMSTNSTFTTSNAAPTITSFSANITNGVLPLTVNFTAVAADSDGFIAKYEWDLDGDGVFEVNSGTASVTSFTYTNAGTYNAKVRVTDNGGATTVSNAVAVTVASTSNQPPVVSSLTASVNSGTVPLSVTLTAAATDPDGTITKYEWDFDGDGIYDSSTATGTATRVYTNLGVYTARVRVTDNGGATATGETTIAVTDGSAGIPGVSASAQSSTGGGGKGGCFIATAAYGSYLDPHVMVLREFRDKVLLTNSLGSSFVAFYYRTSPPVADFISRHESLRTATRVLLTPVVYGVEYPMISAFVLFTCMIGTATAWRYRVRNRI